MEKCVERYVSGQPNVSNNQELLPEAIVSSKQSSFKIHAKYFEPVIDTILECQTTEGSQETSNLVDKPMSSSFFKFCECFNIVLASKYEHLSEEQIFGNPLESSNSKVFNSMIINEFEKLNKCITLQDFQEFFSCWMQSSSVQENVRSELHVSFSVHFTETDLKTNQSLIWNQVEIFCLYLINSRTETMHQFEQFECALYSEMISFEYLRSDSISFKSNLEEVFKSFEQNIADGSTTTDSEIIPISNRVIDLIQQNHCKCSIECIKEAEAQRVCVYTQEKKLYQQLLNVIKKHFRLKVDISSLNQFFDSGVNHFSYFFENLIKLVKLLTQVIQPYKFVSQRRDESYVYSILMEAGLSSRALCELHKWISKQPNRTINAGDEIRLCADAVLYLDDNINYNGVSLVCIAPQILCKKEAVPSLNVNDFPNIASSMSIAINTDGKPIECIEQPKDAQSGDDGTELDKNGKPGHNGKNGCFGNAGGHILLVSSDIHSDDFSLSANGSPGEDGQNGGNGGNGWTSSVFGIDGNNPEFKRGRFKTSSSVVISFGSSGEDSGCGGDAGMGGAPGKAGISGKIEVIDLANELNCQVIQKYISNGKHGQPGIPGKGGKHTRHGRDCGKYGEGLWIWNRFVTFFTSKRPTDSISHYKGELCHKEIPYDRSVPHKSVEQYEKPALNKPPKVVKREDHPDFVDRGFNRDGQNAQTKINNTIANENKAVDKQVCFYLLSDQCTYSLQHWNCKSHEKFLGTFAQKVGEIHRSELFLATHSQLNMSKCAMWISQIHKLSEPTKVSVTYEAKQKTNAKVSLMKDYVEEAKYPSTDDALSYLRSEAVNFEPLLIDVSPLKKRSEYKENHLENILLESLLISDKLDNKIENLQSILCLSEENVYFITCESSCSIDIYCQCYKFLIVHNIQTDRWTFYHSSVSYKMTVNLALKNLAVPANKLYELSREDTISYKDIVEWICENITEDIELPADVEQLCCIKKLEVIICIRKSYEILCTKCNCLELNLIRKVFAIFLDKIVISKSLSDVNSLEHDLKNQSLLFTQFNLNIVEGFFDIDQSEAFLDAIKGYNREHRPDFLLDILVKFQKYHLEMLKRTDYISYLAKPEVNYFLQAFQQTIVDAFQFLCGNIKYQFRLQDIAIVPTNSESILQKIPVKARTGNQTYGYLEVYLDMISLHLHSVTPVEKMFHFVVDKISKILGFNLKPQNQPTTQVTFQKAYTAFCTSPSLKTVLPAIVTFSDSAISDKMKKILLHLYSQVKLLIEEFHELMSIVNFKSSLAEVGLDTDSFIQALSHSLIGLKPPVKSLVCILEQVGKIASADLNCPNSSISIDASRLLIFVPNVLESIFLYYDNLFHFTSDEENLQEKIEMRNHTIDSHSQQFTELHSIFEMYPMSCPIQALIKWKCFMKSKLVEKLELKIKLFSKNNEILKKLKDIKHKVQFLCGHFDHIIAIRKKFVEFQCSRDLQIYSHLFDCDNTLNTEYTVEYEQILANVMGWKKINPDCVKTIAQYFGQNFFSMSQHLLTVELERLQPKYNFLIVCEDHPTNIELHTVILVIGIEHWKLYYSSDNNISHWREVKPDEISQVKDFFHFKFDEKEQCFSLTAEQQSRLISLFKFDTEYNVSHKVCFGQQLLLDKTNCTLCMLSIHVETCEVKLSDDSIFQQDDMLNSSIFVILCDCTSDESLEALKNAEYLRISDEQFTTELKGSVAAMIVKYPDQLPIIKTVTNCGEREVLKHCYSLSLCKENLSVLSLLSDSSERSFQLVVGDNPESSSDPFVSVLQPISDLLKNYHELYGTFLHTSTLNSCLKSVLDECPKVCFIENIIFLVRTIRQKFLQECIVKVIFDNDHQNLVTLRSAVQEEIFSEFYSVSIKDIYLFAMEHFLYFQFVMVKEANEENLIKAIREVSWSFSFWEKAVRLKIFKKEEIPSLCSAFVYLSNNVYVENTLDDEPASIKCRVYQSIWNVLELLPAHMVDEKLKLRIMNHLEVSHLEQCINSENYNEDSIDDLLEIIKTNQSFQNFIRKHLGKFDVGHHINKHIYISKLFFEWFNDELCLIFQLLQDILKSSLFSGLSKKECLMNEFCTSMYSIADEVIENPVEWDSLAELIQIGYSFVQGLKDQMQNFIYNHRSDSSDFLQRMINFTQLLRASPDVSIDLSIVQKVPSDLWLKHLLAYNLFSLLENSYCIVDNLLEKLLVLDQTFLMIFYNTFLNDIHNVSSTNNSASIALSFEQIVVIVDLLQYIEPCPGAFSALCGMSIFLWDKELPKIHFKQYLDHWKDLPVADKQRTVHMMNRVRLDSEMTHKYFMSLLYEIRSKFVRSKVINSTSLMTLIDHIYYKRISLEEVERLTTSADYHQWSDYIHAIESKKTNYSIESRNADSVLDLIQKQSDTEFSKQGIVASIRKEAKELYKHFEYCSLIPNATKKELKDFLSLLQIHVTVEDKLKWLELKKNRVHFVSMLVKSWILSSVSVSYLESAEIPYSTQIISLLLFLHSKNEGLLQQVKTGEGKTLIVGILAGAKALLGFSVDVVSSNRDLAESGMEKCQPFFKLLGLKAAINCTDDDDTNKQSYKAHIVYGDVGSFQHDWLLHESEPDPEINFKTRYSIRKNNCLIVDEVDSMFLDKAQHMLYLSHDSPALKHLESLFLYIWSAVNSLPSLDNLQIEEMTKNLITLVKNNTIKVPDYLKEFCENKIQSWILSANHAKNMDANDQFVIDYQKQRRSEVKRIFPIDKQTGIEQYNMRWTDGLSQFLELKYRRPMSSESLKAIFISNKRFFQKYETRLFGLSGTLGSVVSRALLCKVYDIKTVELPTNKAKRYTQRKSRIGTNEEHWCAQIYAEISITSSEQPILIICENIKQLECIKQYILSQGTINEADIINYARDGDNVEKVFKTQQGAKPGQIVLATNKGGRGTDIIINNKEVSKGLHVILTFLTENTRIEEQAFGRAARAGQTGSGCLVVQFDHCEYQSLLQNFDTVEAATEVIVEIEKTKRNDFEADRLIRLQNVGLPKLELEEDLYLSFQKCKKIFTQSLENSTFMDVKLNKSAKSAFLLILTNHWAYWLDSMHARIYSTNLECERQETIDVFNASFPVQGYSPPSKIDDSTFFKHPENYVSLGIGFIEDIECLTKSNKTEQEHQYLKAALACFNRANDIGDRTGLAAMASCYCFIKLNKDANRTNMKQARRYLKKAKTHLIILKQNFMANAEIGSTLYKLINVSQYVHDEENYYCHQIEEKLKILGLHLHTVELLLGSNIDEHSFIRESPISEEKISEKSPNLYTTV